jgi:hypothetical protein
MNKLQAQMIEFSPTCVSSFLSQITASKTIASKSTAVSASATANQSCLFTIRLNQQNYKTNLLKDSCKARRIIF